MHESRSGLSEARNRAVAVARGSLLLFTDDDCLPAPDWVTAALRAFDGDFHQVIGGRVELHDPKDAPITIRTSLIAETLTSSHKLPGFMHGCNMAIGRPVIEKVGLFDIWFGAGSSFVSAEDTDLIYRSLKAGFRVSYNPSMVVFHNHGRRAPDEVEKLIEGYKIGMGALAMKHLLEGDTGLAKTCYWNFRSAIRACVGRKASLIHLRTESHLILGAVKFCIRTGSSKVERETLQGHQQPALPVRSADSSQTRSIDPSQTRSSMSDAPSSPSPLRLSSALAEVKPLPDWQAMR